MGHRLSKIYTRTGDDGTTGLADGSRVPKWDRRVEAFGTVDETNAAIGSILAEPDLGSALRETLERVQHELFEVGAELSLPEYRAVEAKHVAQIEADLDALNEDLPPLEEFVLPGGNRAAAAAHVARTVCRRAEREAWKLAAQGDLNEALLRYLNRLSDYLFVAARTLARRGGGSEILWKR